MAAQSPACPGGTTRPSCANLKRTGTTSGGESSTTAEGLRRGCVSRYLTAQIDELMPPPPQFCTRKLREAPSAGPRCALRLALCRDAALAAHFRQRQQRWRRQQQRPTKENAFRLHVKSQNAAPRPRSATAWPQRLDRCGAGPPLAILEVRHHSNSDRVSARALCTAWPGP